MKPRKPKGGFGSATAKSESIGSGGAYFAAPTSSLKFINSGCCLLNCVLGGGWPLGRISNVVGDKSTGKTLLAIEACANFAQQFPKGHIYYREAEAAFDIEYAKALGLPTNHVNFSDTFHTVEDMFEDLTKVANQSKSTNLYIVDSLDALSDREELKRDMDKGTYGAQKAKIMSELLRRLAGKVESSQTHVMIVSQVRDKIGATFGRQWNRSGGRALDFYASQILVLSHLKRLKHTIKGVERASGVRIRAHCDKNKVGLPFRECEFEIRFGYGIYDVAASLEWLESVGRLYEIEGMTKAEMPTALKRLESMSRDAMTEVRQELDERVRLVWSEIEQSFLPKHSKY